MQKVGLAIIGLGNIGNIHLINSQKLTNARLVAVSDVSKKALARVGRLGVEKTYSKYEDLLKDPEVDAVIIALPTYLHLQCAEKAAEAGKHVFLEKPMARNVDEAREISLTARKNSTKLMIGYPMRFEPAFSNIKKDIIARIAGDIHLAIANYLSLGPFSSRAEDDAPSPVPDWWFRRELTGGGALIDVGCHLINLFRWYFGEITDIESRLGYRFNMDFEDQAICLVRFESGTFGVISASWLSQEFRIRVELSGTAGNVEAQVPEPQPTNILGILRHLLVPRPFSAYVSELQYFVDCLVQDIGPSPSGEDGLRDMEAISRAYDNSKRLG